MTNSYKLSHTAEEIDAKLGKIDTLEPTHDDIPKVFIDGNIPVTKDEVQAEMEYTSKTESFHAYLKIKCQGDSSMGYPKKNFTIKMYSDESLGIKFEKAFKDWGYESNKYVLKANYIDHTHARNIVSANLWCQTVASRPDYESLPEELKNSPKNGAIDGFPIKLYSNGDYQGIYTWNIPKDAWMFGMDEDNPNHVLLAAETNTDQANPCNFTALWSGVDGTDWSVEVGTNSEAVKNSLNNLISCVMNTNDTTFKSTIGQYLDVQSAIDYVIHQDTICAPDNVAKNLLLATYDGVKWFCCAYDMDATFGSNAEGTGVIPPNEYWPWNDPSGIGLWRRIRGVFKNEYKQRYAELHSTVYTKGNMVSAFEHFMDIVGVELYEEDLEIYPDIPTVPGGIKEVRNFIRDHEWYVDRRGEGAVYSLVTGEHTFSDTLAMSVSTDSNGFVSVTVPNPDNSTFPGINISNVALNGESCTGDNGQWGQPEQLKLYAGDVIRLVVDADTTLNMNLAFNSANDFTKLMLIDNYWNENKQKFIDKEIVVENDFSVGCIVIQPRASSSFRFKIYVNGNRWM